MTTIQRITYSGRKRPARGATPRHLASVELTDINAKSNAQRMAEYVSKRTAMESAA